MVKFYYHEKVYHNFNIDTRKRFFCHVWDQETLKWQPPQRHRVYCQEVTAGICWSRVTAGRSTEDETSVSYGVAQVKHVDASAHVSSNWMESLCASRGFISPSLGKAQPSLRVLPDCSLVSSSCEVVPACHTLWKEVREKHHTTHYQPAPSSVTFESIEV
ncbi:hypothetical protein GOODEAATRI_030892 [Goodea atripinnis]|uniref:Uncharacterized protein n=1 Tax=Goodea atripinnis TaxID=208336 RepID=A0ABV0NPH3_9TELE